MDSRAGVGSSCFTVPDKSASPVDLLFAVVHNYPTPGKKGKRKKTRELGSEALYMHTCGDFWDILAGGKKKLAGSGILFSPARICT